VRRRCHSPSPPAPFSRCSTVGFGRRSVDVRRRRLACGRTRGRRHARGALVRRRRVRDGRRPHPRGARVIGRGNSSGRGGRAQVGTSAGASPVVHPRSGVATGWQQDRQRRHETRTPTSTPDSAPEGEIARRPETPRDRARVLLILRSQVRSLHGPSHGNPMATGITGQAEPAGGPGLGVPSVPLLTACKPFTQNERREGLCGGLLKLGLDVLVDILSEGCAAVTDPIAHHASVGAGQEREACVGMAEIVQSDAREAALLRKAPGTSW
jgi:hypothetical protein